MRLLSPLVTLVQANLIRREQWRIILHKLYVSSEDRGDNYDQNDETATSYGDNILASYSDQLHNCAGDRSLLA